MYLPGNLIYSSRGILIISYGGKSHLKYTHRATRRAKSEGRLEEAPLIARARARSLKAHFPFVAPRPLPRVLWPPRLLLLRAETRLIFCHTTQPPRFRARHVDVCLSWEERCETASTLCEHVGVLLLWLACSASAKCAIVISIIARGVGLTVEWKCNWPILKLVLLDGASWMTVSRSLLGWLCSVESVLSLRRCLVIGEFRVKCDRVCYSRR